MGIFDNLDPDTMALMSAAGAMATPATRVPVPLGYSIGQAISAIPQGVRASQELKQGGMANQMGALNLQKAQAMQPMILNQIKGMTGGGSPMGVPGGGGDAGGAGTSDALFSQALMSAYMSGDMGKAATVLQSWAEHNPALAGQIKASQERNTPQKMADDTYQLGGGAFGSPAAGMLTPQPGGAPPAPQTVNGRPQAPENMDELLNQQTQSPGNAPAAPSTPANIPMASDGKPLVPGMTNLFKPDPTETPFFGNPKTKNAVDLVNQNQKDLSEGDKEFTTLANSFNNEGTRLNNLIDIFKQTQSGTAMAHFPELLNKAVSLGIVKDPSTVKNLSDLQTANQNFILDVIGQIKDTNANLGGSTAARTFGSEINELLEHGQSVKDQPQALWNILSQAKGLVDQHTDMLNGWQAIGGRGNRAAGGHTMLPNDYSQAYLLAHPSKAFIKNAQDSMGTFKGMPGNGGASPIRVQTPDGRMGTIDPAHLQSLLSAGGKVIQ